MSKNKLAYSLTLISILLNLVFYWFGFYDFLEQKLYDYRFKLRGPLSGDYIYEQSNKLKSRYSNSFDSCLSRKYTLKRSNF